MAEHRHQTSLKTPLLSTDGSDHGGHGPGRHLPARWSSSVSESPAGNHDDASTESTTGRGRLLPHIPRLPGRSQRVAAAGARTIAMQRMQRLRQLNRQLQRQHQERQAAAAAHSSRSSTSARRSATPLAEQSHQLEPGYESPGCTYCMHKPGSGGPAEQPQAPPGRLLPPVPHHLGLRRVVLIDSLGRATVRQVDRSWLVAEFGIPHRDLRTVDPELPTAYPMALLIRERALVVNVEVARLLVSSDKVCLLSVRHEAPSCPDCVQGCSPLDCPLIAAMSAALKPPRRQAAGPAARTGLQQHAQAQLPYELRALEVALHAVVAAFDQQVSRVVSFTLPALDSLVAKVHAASLGEVREAKRRLQDLKGRLQALAGGLEDMLEDEGDLQDLYLGRRAELERDAAELSDDDGDGEAPPPPAAASHGAQEAAAQHGGVQPAAGTAWPSATGGSSTPATAAASKAAAPALSRAALASMPVQQHAARLAQQMSPDAAGPAAVAAAAATAALGARATVSATLHQREYEAAENLLETYYLQVEHLMGRLAHLEQQVDATEDLVNIDLDSRRNQLVALDLLVTSITLMFTLVTAVTGVFGMNLANGLEEASGAFVAVTVISFVAGAALCCVFLGYVWIKGLMNVPEAGVIGGPGALAGSGQQGGGTDSGGPKM